MVISFPRGTPIGKFAVNSVHLRVTPQREVMVMRLGSTSVRVHGTRGPSPYITIQRTYDGPYKRCTVGIQPSPGVRHKPVPDRRTDCCDIMRGVPAAGPASPGSMWARMHRGSHTHRRRRSAYAVPSKAGRKVWAGDLFPLISARHPTRYRLVSAYWVFFLRQGLVVFCLLLASDFIVWDPRCLDGELLRI